MAANAQETSSFLDELPKIEWRPEVPLLQLKGYWLFPWIIESLSFIETEYKPLPTDVVVASFPKSGTTWLKSLTFAIMHYHAPNDQLQTHNPHELIPMIEGKAFRKQTLREIEKTHLPRIFSTHLPYSILPENVISSNCKIVYIFRDPADIIVSGWHFTNNMYDKHTTLEQYFNQVIDGTTPSGPLFNHVLEYWKVREKENILFVKYEDLSSSPNENVKRISEFLGCSLSDDDIAQVVKKSSFERLSKLDINSGEMGIKFAEKISVKYSSFFRNGSVGDGKKCLTPEMKKRLNDVAYYKWKGSGLESKLLVADPQGLTNIE